jgi:shikimate kinase
VNIYLIGFMGSGKSTAGRKMASLLHWNYSDIDRLVEEREGCSVSELFARRGENYFREAESEVLRSLSNRSRTIVACGGGTPCSPANIEVMKSTGVVVYLKLTAQELTERLQKSRTVRPLIHDAGSDEMKMKVENLLESRTCWYEMADLTVDGMNDTIEEITARVADMVRAKGAFL